MKVFSAIASLLPFFQPCLAREETYPDNLHIDKCICASDTRIGYSAIYTLRVDSLRLGDHARIHRWGDFVHDKYMHGRSLGYQCTPGNITDCKRVPDISQYTSSIAITPGYHGDVCTMLDNGHEICPGSRFLQIDEITKMLHQSLMSKRPQKANLEISEVTDCAEQCRDLWPEDDTTRSLCWVTDLDRKSSTYGQPNTVPITGNRLRRGHRRITASL